MIHPTCTIEACNLRDNYSLLKKEGIVVLGVSPDDEKKHKKFEQKFDLPFTLVADPAKKLLTNMEFGERRIYMAENIWACTALHFLIDEKGIIQKIFRKPRSKIHTQEILKAWDEINDEKKHK